MVEDRKTVSVDLKKKGARYILAPEIESYGLPDLPTASPVGRKLRFLLMPKA